MCFISSEWISLQHHVIATAANNPKHHYLYNFHDVYLTYKVEVMAHMTTKINGKFDNNKIFN